MAEEEKGFTIKDRRAFDESGDLKAEETAEKPKEKPKEEGKPKEAEAPPRNEAERTPLPEVNFNSLIFSLSSSALLHLGEIADPATGAKSKDLALAKHTIDTLAMLKEKTEGNLNDEEKRFLESILADLRWRYVKAAE
jgi:hypothetical protein